MLRPLLAALAALLVASAPAHARSPQANVDDLLRADRAFATAAARAASPAEALAAMLDREAIMPVPGQGLAVGREAVVAALRANPDLREGAASWAPVRGGISADGTQGFNFGFLQVSGGDPAHRARKYLAYWIHRPEGWRVVALRQVVRPAGEVSTALMPASLPNASGRAAAGRIPDLAAAEQAFSDRAQQIGLRAAFREFGRDDAMNMGNSAGFTLGAEAISQMVGGGEPTSPLHWSTEHAFVAASGDLGVSIGTIRVNHPVEGQPASFPFFTVWRRDLPNGPWRYIAE